MQYKLSSILLKKRSVNPVFSVKSVFSVNPVPAVNPVLCTWNSVKRHYEIILEGSRTFHEANLCKLEYVDTAYVTCI